MPAASTAASAPAPPVGESASLTGAATAACVAPAVSTSTTDAPASHTSGAGTFPIAAAAPPSLRAESTRPPTAAAHSMHSVQSSDGGSNDPAGADVATAPPGSRSPSWSGRAVPQRSGSSGADSQSSADAVDTGGVAAAGGSGSEDGSISGVLSPAPELQALALRSSSSAKPALVRKLKLRLSQAPPLGAVLSSP